VLLFIPDEILPSNAGRHFAKVRPSLENDGILDVVNSTLFLTSLPSKNCPASHAEAGQLAE
jgi:hypothetical protein